MMIVRSFSISFLILTTLILSPLFTFCIVNAASHTKPNKTAQRSCSTQCVVQDCNSIGIRYGKYCGVGWTGCPGEKPCDDLDACCKEHDHCVEKKGMTNITCHEKFKRCIKKVQKSGKVGFLKNAHMMWQFQR